MKDVRVVFMLCISLMIMAVSSNAEIVDRIIAVVNGDIITLSEFNKEFESYMGRLEKASPEADRETIEKQVRRMVLYELIDTTLIEQEAKKLGVMATDKDIDNAINSIIEGKKMSTEAFEEAIAKEGGSLDEYKEELKRHLTKRNLIAREIKRKITVSTEEVGEYYRKHREDYEGKEAAKISQILIIVPKKSDAETKGKKRRHAEEILERIKKGEPFSVLAVELSEGPAAKTGGDLGYVEKGLMLPVVDEVAFTLKPGETSEVIESPIGFHIIRVVDKRGAGIKPIDAVKNEIIETIGGEKIEQKFREWIKQQREKSHIDIRL